MAPSPTPEKMDQEHAEAADEGAEDEILDTVTDYADEAAVAVRAETAAAAE